MARHVSGAPRLWGRLFLTTPRRGTVWKDLRPLQGGGAGCDQVSLAVADDCQGVAPKVVLVSGNKVVSEVGGNPMSESSPRPYDQVS